MFSFIFDKSPHFYFIAYLNYCVFELKNAERSQTLFCCTMKLSWINFKHKNSGEMLIIKTMSAVYIMVIVQVKFCLQWTNNGIFVIVYMSQKFYLYRLRQMTNITPAFLFYLHHF